MKKCSKCKQEKSLGKFAIHYGGKFGVRGQCKKCRGEQMHRYYNEHKNIYSIWNKQNYQNHKQEYAKRHKKYYQSHKKETVERQHQYYLSHKAERLQYNQNNRTKILEYLKIYFKTEKGKVSHTNSRSYRRSIYKNTNITTKWLLNLRNQTQFCSLCNIAMADNGSLFNGKTLDHIIPLNSKCLGKHNKQNVRYICRRCNTKRPKDGSDLIDGSVYA